jgi:outer membrane lipoprotein carrier protein
MAVVKYWFPSAIKLALVLAASLGLGVFLWAEDAWAEESGADARPADVAGDASPSTSDAELLSARLKAMHRFAGRFTQAIAGGRGQVLEESTGYVLLDRPNFKWVVDDPYPQIIITEGGMLKVYDPDLEQLTIRPLAEALKDTPVSLLTQEDVVLGGDYLVMQTEVDAYIIAPLSADTLFAEIRLTFTELGLSTLGILDHLGQYTEIRFEPDPDRVIQSSDFELEVPPETDVIGG